MKFFVATALAISTVSAAQCELSALTTALTPLITPATACQTTVGYQIIPPSALPTADQVKKICTECQDLITAAKTVTFPTCTFPIGGKDVAINEIFAQVAGQCGGASNSTTGKNDTAPATTAPAATTVAPGKSNATDGSKASGSKGGAAVVTPPSSTTAKPNATTTPAPTKSAGVSATVGAAVAIACSIAALVL